MEKLELVLGYFAGPMGATNVLILVFCFLYLLLRRTVSWRMTVPFLLACALFAFLFPRIEVAPHYSVLYELFSGQLVFGAIFILNDPVTTPKRPGAQVLYGAVTGVITMLFRYFGGFEVGLIFAVLVMNVFTPMIDRGFENAIRLERRGRHALFRLSGKGTSKESSPERTRTVWKRRRISSLSGLFYRNPAAVTGVMLAPLVVVCTSLQTAAALSLVFLVLSVPVQLAAGLGGRYLPKPLWLPGHAGAVGQCCCTPPITG